MEIKVESNSQHHDESKHPLLRDTTETEEKTLIQKAISQTLIWPIIYLLDQSLLFNFYHPF